MVTLTGNHEEELFRGRVPDVALRRAREMGCEGVVVLVLERGDDVQRDFTTAGRYGLLTYLDNHYQAPFQYVRYVVEGGRRVFEALLLPSGRHLLVVPDEEWVDTRLRVVLDVESENPPLQPARHKKSTFKSVSVGPRRPEGDRKVDSFSNGTLQR